MIHTIQLIHHQNFLDVRKQSADLRHPYGDFYRLDECQILRIVKSLGHSFFNGVCDMKCPRALGVQELCYRAVFGYVGRTVLSSHR